LYYRFLLFILIFLLTSFTYSVDYYNTDGLLHFWNFENKQNFEADVKLNVEGYAQGKTYWVPPEFSFANPESGVIHLHGDKSPSAMFIVQGYKLYRDLTDWTLDFEFAAGTHNINEKNHDHGSLVDGTIMRWGDVRIDFFRDRELPRSRGVIVIDFRGRKKFIQNVLGYDYYYMAIRSEDEGISIWLNSYCTNLIKSSRRSIAGKQLTFGGSGFAGRIDDIKIYNRRLEPWEITQNYWGNNFAIDLRSKHITTWANEKIK
jgi:hypothetical protein